MVFCSAVISLAEGDLPEAQFADWLVPSGHSHTTTSTLSYQSPLALVICAWVSTEAPMNRNEMKVTSVSDSSIDRLRVRLAHVFGQNESCSHDDRPYSFAPSAG